LPLWAASAVWPGGQLVLGTTRDWSRPPPPRRQLSFVRRCGCGARFPSDLAEGRGQASVAAHPSLCPASPRCRPLRARACWPLAAPRVAPL